MCRRPATDARLRSTAVTMLTTRASNTNLQCFSYMVLFLAIITANHFDAVEDSCHSHSFTIANWTLDNDDLRRKAVFRAAKASYHLGQYEKTIELASSRLDDPECRSWKVKAEERIRERDTGIYDWCSLFNQAQEASAHIDVADFVGPIEVRRGKKGGIRGTFATRDIKIGELLVSIPSTTVVH